LWQITEEKKNIASAIWELSAISQQTTELCWSWTIIGMWIVAWVVCKQA